MLKRLMYAATAAALVAAGSVAMLATPSSAGGPIVVNTTADNLTDDGDCTLREAIHLVNGDLANGDCTGTTSPASIVLPAGTITLATGGDDDDNTENDFDVFAGTTGTITGMGVGVTILDGGGLDRIFDFDLNLNDEWTLEGVTVRNGADNDGAAVNNDGTLTIRNSAFEDNDSTADGGAIDNDEAILVIENTTFTRNTAEGNGGAIENESGSTLTVTGSTFTDNESGEDGGAIANQNEATATVTDSTFDGNSTDGDSGALDNGDGATATITGSTFVGNTAAGAGGAIENDSNDAFGGGDLTVTNSTFSGNQSTESGSAVDNGEGGTASFVHVTVTGNSTSQGEGALFSDLRSTFELTNTIVAENTGGDCAVNVEATGDEFVSNGGNIDSDDSCELDQGSDQPNVADVMLGALASNGGPTQTHLPLAGSPAIDTATEAGCVSDDQRDEPRPADGDDDGVSACDVGAVEVQPAEEPPPETPEEEPEEEEARAAEAVPAQPSFTG